MKRKKEAIFNKKSIIIIVTVALLYGVPLISLVMANYAKNIKTALSIYINPVGPITQLLIRSDVRAISILLYLVFGIIVAFVLINKATSLKTNEEHGSARWATDSEIRNHKDFEMYSFSKKIKKVDNEVKYLEFGDKSKGAGPLLVYDANKEKGYIDTSNDHVYYEAATGEGKDRRAVDQTIKIISDYGENMVINDTKKESFHKFATYLEKECGYDVYCLDYRNPELGNRYNHLDEILNYIDEGNVTEAEDLTQVISAGIDCDPGVNEEKIWVDGRRAVISSIILSLCLSNAPRKSKSLFNCFTTLREMGDIVTDYKAGIEKCRLNDWYNLPERERVEKNSYAPAKIAQDKTKMSFFVNVLTSLSFAANEKLADQMCESDFSIHDLADEKRKPMAVFVNVPYETENKDKIGNIFYDSLFRVLTQDALKMPGGRLNRRVHLVMNEFTNLAKQQSIVKKLTVARSTNLRYYFYSQSESMLEEVYGEKIAKTFLDNCKIKIYLSAASYQTAENLSKSVSEYTIIQQSLSSKAQGLFPSNDISNTQSLIGKRLITADEIMYDIEQGWAIIQKFRLRPLFSYFSDVSEIPFFSTLKIRDRLDDEVNAREVYRIEEYILDQGIDHAKRKTPIISEKKKGRKIIKAEDFDVERTINDLDDLEKYEFY